MAKSCVVFLRKRSTLDVLQSSKFASEVAICIYCEGQVSLNFLLRHLKILKMATPAKACP